MPYIIGKEELDLKSIRRILHEKQLLSLSESATERIQNCRQFLDDKLQDSEAMYYGINTGFGSLCNISISAEEIQQLQVNLVRSHACGMGDPVPQQVVKLMLLLKIQSLSYGRSGVQLETVQRLIWFFNEDILPVIYKQGSLGASGDLAPLAHLSLPLLGEGEIYVKGVKQETSQYFAKHGLMPIQLKSKEGLALLNGTQFSASYLVWCLLESEYLLESANMCAAFSLDVFEGRLEPFDDRLQQVRPHPGQAAVARSVRQWLDGSLLGMAERKYVQDPYAFRCVPQVHGASLDTLNYVKRLALVEINAVTDNPNIFPESDAILSGGNFHAQPLAFGLDFLSIAIAELGSISERRVFQLISGSRDLPAFLTPEPGLNSGLMIPQYTAASIVSQNKQLCTPASVDSIVSSNGQEDHVSMAANAATKTYKVVENVERLIAIEFFTAAQALEFRRPVKSSGLLEKLISQYRTVVPQVEKDRVLAYDINNTVTFLRNAYKSGQIMQAE